MGACSQDWCLAEERMAIKGKSDMEKPGRSAPSTLSEAQAQDHKILELKMRNRGAQGGRQNLKIALHNQNEVISDFLRMYGVWQRPLTVFIDSILKPGDVFVDVGANIGYFSIVAASAVGPKGRVHSFEPDPKNFELLGLNRRLNGLDHIVCHRLALADQPRKTLLYRSTVNRGSHSLRPGPDLTDGIEVSVTTLGRALHRETTPIRLIKIDVQGTDLWVLKGVGRLLDGRSAKPMIVLEFSPKDNNALDRGLTFFRDFVTQHDYRVHAFIANERLSAIPPRIGLATLLALHEDLVRYGEDAEFDILLMPQAGRG